MLRAIYWSKQIFPLFTFICLSQPGDLLRVQNWKKKRNQATFGDTATTLIAREAVTIIYLLLCEHLTSPYIPSSKDGKHGLNETPAKWVQKRLENLIHKFIICCSLPKKKEVLTAVLQKVCPATDTLINGIIEQRAHFFILQMVSSLEGLQGYQWTGSGFRVIPTNVWEPSDFSHLCTADWEQMQEGRWLIWQQLCRKWSQGMRRTWVSIVQKRQTSYGEV